MDLADIDRRPYGVEYVRGWKERVKWFRSEAERTRWILANEGHVWLGGMRYRELPTVISGSFPLRVIRRLFGRGWLQ